MADNIVSPSPVGVTVNTVTFTKGTAAVLLINGFSSAKKPTTKARYSHVVRARSTAARPQTKAGFGISYRARGTVKRAQTTAALTYLIFTDRDFSQQPSPVNVSGERVDFEIVPTRMIVASGRVGGPRTRARLSSPAYINVTARAPSTVSVANVYVPFAARSISVAPRARTSIGVFIPPFEINAVTKANRPTNKTVILVPIVSSGNLRQRAPKLSADIVSKYNVTAAWRPPAPTLYAEIGTYSTTYGYLVHPAAPTMSGSLKYRWIVRGDFVPPAPRMSGSIMNDRSVKATAELVNRQRPTMSGMILQMKIFRRRSLIIIP